ncbi:MULTISPECIES: MipA/OmpV family protein [Gammaproteobacteria]|uniref:Structural protein MipA n=1 Tax=Xanthomonas boreopolis TaxID=86183 RepID=A0A919F6D8_9XANT|nr:MipA/OmpV family protein [Pseudomonas sp. Hp2]GHH49402.1 structural protein MipA [[Pseudomonas] boreopolis]
MTRLPALFFLLFPSLALAQSSVVEDVASTSAPKRWQLGAGVSVNDSPYVGEGMRIRPFPWVSYEGERLFWRGLSGGVHVHKSDGFVFDAILAGNFDGFDIDDLSRSGLERNGLDPARLEDRDDGVDAGLAATWRGAAGELKLQALADVTDRSGGYELGLDYGYPRRWGRTLLIPSVGVRWLSKDVVRYYYGTLDEEEARGVAPYRPDAALVPQVRLGIVRPLGGNWRLVGALSYRFLPSEIGDSPFLERGSNGTGSLQLGFVRSF